MRRALAVVAFTAVAAVPVAPAHAAACNPSFEVICTTITTVCYALQKVSPTLACELA